MHALDISWSTRAIYIQSSHNSAKVTFEIPELIVRTLGSGVHQLRPICCSPLIRMVRWIEGYPNVLHVHRDVLLLVPRTCLKLKMSRLWIV